MLSSRAQRLMWEGGSFHADSSLARVSYFLRFYTVVVIREAEHGGALSQRPKSHVLLRVMEPSIDFQWNVDTTGILIRGKHIPSASADSTNTL
jgi:hypothetical protein